MGSLKQFRQDLLSELAKCPALSGYTFLEEYPSVQNRKAIIHPAVIAGFQEISLPGSPLNQLYNQVSEITGNHHVREADVKMVLSVYVPAEMDSNTCYGIFSEICDYLLFSSEYDCGAIKAGKLQFDRQLDAYVYDAILSFTAMLVQEEE